MVDQQNYDTIISALYATLTDPSGWTGALEALRQGFDCTITSLNTSSDGAQRSWSTAPCVSENWVRHWATANPIGCLGMETGQVALARDRVDHRTLLASAYYNEFLLPADIPQVMIIRGPWSGRYGAVVNILRGRRQPIFAEAEVVAARRLSGHIVNALDTAMMLGWKSWAELTASLEEAPEGMILVDAAGAILHMNRVARALTEAREGIAVGGRRLDTVGREGKRLREAIWRATDGPAPRTGAMLTIERASGKRPLIASITPLDEITVDIGVPRPRALIAVLDPERAAAFPSDDLQRLFGLTRREADVAQALGEGLSIAEAAARCGVTLATARNYLARVLRKTQLNRQGELVQLLNGLTRLADTRRRI